jgi:hypothetical protein
MAYAPLNKSGLPCDGTNSLRKSLYWRGRPVRYHPETSLYKCADGKGYRLAVIGVARENVATCKQWSAEASENDHHCAVSKLTVGVKLITRTNRYSVWSSCRNLVRPNLMYSTASFSVSRNSRLSTLPQTLPSISVANIELILRYLNVERGMGSVKKA